MKALKRVLAVAAFAVMALVFAQIGDGKLAMRSRLQRRGAVIPKGEKPGQLDQPLAMQTGSQGELYVLSQDAGVFRLQRFDAGLAFQEEAPARALAGLDAPLGLALGPDAQPRLLDRQGRLRALGPKWRPGRDQLGLPKNARGFESAQEGGFWVLVEDGSAVERWSEDGKLLESRMGAVSGGKALTVDSQGVPILLLEGPKVLRLRRLTPGKPEPDYRVPYVAPAGLVRAAALPDGKVVLNDAGSIGIEVVDLLHRHCYRRAFESDQGEFFRTLSFVAADPRSGRIYVPHGGGTIAGELP
jgi:hypothetical protein